MKTNKSSKQSSKQTNKPEVDLNQYVQENLEFDPELDIPVKLDLEVNTETFLKFSHISTFESEKWGEIRNVVFQKLDGFFYSMSSSQLLRYFDSHSEKVWYKIRRTEDRDIGKQLPMKCYKIFPLDEKGQESAQKVMEHNVASGLYPKKSQDTPFLNLV